ncbi:MAG: hypothetical protein A2X49_16360 [Lentisphaerae bacterium GWF2_52_8]|nr:MAG: hypothetical protein A2X49_16360 [Lentisphaerae bacterium GWF2_52_8]
MENLISAMGILVFAAIAWGFCCDKGQIKWRPVIGGLFFQLLFASILFAAPGARTVFLLFSEVFTNLLGYSRDGIVFVFGELGAEKSPEGLILAFQVFPLIIVFSSIMTLLFYLRVIPWLVEEFARFLASWLKTSGAESLCAVSNIFVGIESATAVRPYLTEMTRSEIFTVLTVGMSTVASSVMAVYVMLLHEHFPAIAGHLVSASILSVPASFTISKLMVPETGDPRTTHASACRMHFEDEPSSMMESLIIGASNGAKLAVGVAVTLIAFVGILGIARGALASASGGAVSLEGMLGAAFYPFTWLMGIPVAEVPAVAKMLGERLILTEIPAYIDLAKFAAAGGSPRSILIASYALCGFTHIASVAIFVGGIGALAPVQLPVLAKLGLKALLAATLVTLMTGAVAGLFYWGQLGVLQ